AEQIRCNPTGMLVALVKSSSEVSVCQIGKSDTYLNFNNLSSSNNLFNTILIEWDPTGRFLCFGPCEKDKRIYAYDIKNKEKYISAFCNISLNLNKVFEVSILIFFLLIFPFLYARYKATSAKLALPHLTDSVKFL